VNKATKKEDNDMPTPTKQETDKKNNSTPPPVAMTPPPEETALDVFDYGDDSGQGFENQDMSFRKLPMLVVLQSNSPQVVESKGKVHAGQLFNTVTSEVFDEIIVIPAVLDSCFLQFIPRDDGGGFRGRHKTDSKVVKEAIARNEGRTFGKLPVPQPPDPKTGKPQPTHELVENYEMYAITTRDDEVTGFAVIPFQSTKIKVLRAWNTQIGMFAPKMGGKQFKAREIPMFGHRVKITTEMESNAKGSFFVPVLSPAMGGDDLVKSLIGRNDPRYQAAKQLHDEVVAGKAKAAYETMEQEPAQDPEAGVPF
jgi:hypothetical protein